MGEHPVILCLQDMTELNFNGQQIEGLGPLSYQVQRGMYVHPTYAVTPERLPLGVIDAWMWAREKVNAAGVWPGIKESGRWIEGYGRIAEMAVEMPATRLVYVADREADMIELMAYAQECGTPADWLVRAKTNRALPDGEKLWAHTLDGAPVGGNRLRHRRARQAEGAQGTPATVGQARGTAGAARRQDRGDLPDRA